MIQLLDDDIKGREEAMGQVQASDTKSQELWARAETLSDRFPMLYPWEAISDQFQFIRISPSSKASALVFEELLADHHYELLLLLAEYAASIDLRSTHRQNGVRWARKAKRAQESMGDHTEEELRRADRQRLGLHCFRVKVIRKVIFSLGEQPDSTSIYRMYARDQAHALELGHGKRAAFEKVIDVSARPMQEDDPMGHLADVVSIACEFSDRTFEAKTFREANAQLDKWRKTLKPDDRLSFSLKCKWENETRLNLDVTLSQNPAHRVETWINGFVEQILDGKTPPGWSNEESVGRRRKLIEETDGAVTIHCEEIRTQCRVGDWSSIRFAR